MPITITFDVDDQLGTASVDAAKAHRRAIADLLPHRALEGSAHIDNRARTPGLSAIALIARPHRPAPRQRRDELRLQMRIPGE